MCQPSTGASRRRSLAPSLAQRGALRLPLLCVLFALPASRPLLAQAADMNALIERCRTGDAFLRERAEGEVRQRGAEALPAIARVLADPDRQVRLRLWQIFRDLLQVALEELDADASAALHDEVEETALTKLSQELPAAIEKLRQEVEGPREPKADPEEERRIAAEIAEKAQRLRTAQEALRDAEARLPDIKARRPERVRKSDDNRKRILQLGAPVFGPLTARREAVLLELDAFYQKLLDEILAGLSQEELFPPLRGDEGPGDEGGGGVFEQRRYLLSPIWARLGRHGPAVGPAAAAATEHTLAAKARACLERHLALVARDLRSGESPLRERAEEDLYFLGPRGIEALKANAAKLPREQVERLQGLYEWRIEPRLFAQTGMDFREYRDLPFRARRRHVIRYARVAGRAAIPTLRLIALDEKREGSLRVRLAAAEALAGPNIRDVAGLLVFREKNPELLKIPKIARDFTLIHGIELLEEKRYADAIEEFKKILDEAPYDFPANYRIAFAYLLMKNYAKSIFHFEIARRVQPGDELTLYNLACAYSLDGQIDKAIEVLEAAANAGFQDYQHMERDPDLAPLRADPRYHELIDRLQKSPPRRTDSEKADPDN